MTVNENVPNGGTKDLNMKDIISDGPSNRISNQYLFEYVANILLYIKVNQSNLSFRKSLSKIVTETTGINFSEQVNDWHSDIKDLLRLLGQSINEEANFSDDDKKSLIGILSGIKSDEKLITPELEEKFRAALLKPLDRKKWYYQCHQYFLDQVVRTGE
jgi:hypothetical protein